MKSLRGRTSPTICSASGRRGLRHISAIKSSPRVASRRKFKRARQHFSAPSSVPTVRLLGPSPPPTPHPQPPADRGHSGCLLSLLLKASLSPPDLVSPKGAWGGGGERRRRNECGAHRRRWRKNRRPVSEFQEGREEFCPTKPSESGTLRLFLPPKDCFSPAELQ